MSETDIRTPLTSTQNSRLWLTVAGLIQGLGFYLLVKLGGEHWKISGSLFFAGAVFLATAPPLFQLTFGIGKLRDVVVASFAAPIFLALLWLWSDVRLELDESGAVDDGQAWWFVLSVGLAIHILLPFTQTYFEERGLRFPYASLFRFSWNNALIVAVSLAFLGAFWLVLLLWALLFNLVEIRVFSKIFQNALFGCVFSGTAFGLGIALVRENARILLGLRRIVLVLFRILSPVLAIVGLLFLIVLPFTGLETLWETSAATPILIGLAFWSVVFVNAVIQDGENTALFPKPINWAIAAHLVTLPVFAGLAYYALSLRIDQYGLTPGRFAAMLIVILAGLQVLAYAAAVLRSPKNWIGLATRANPAMALIIAATALLIHTPLLDPYSRSAANQLDRFVSGKVDIEGYDYGFLRFKLGAPGRSALDEIRALAQEHPESGAIGEQLAVLDEAENYWQWKFDEVPEGAASAERAAFIKKILLRPTEFEVPEQVADLIFDYRESYVNQCVNGDAKCGLLSLDIDSDGREEYLFISSQPYYLPLLIFRHLGTDEWTRADRSGISGAIEFDYESAVGSIVSGDYELVEPVYPDIRIGTQRLRF